MSKAQKSEAIRGDELDLLKLFFWLLLVLTIALTGVWLWHRNKLEEKLALIDEARSKLLPLASQKAEVQAMMSVYTTNKEEDATERPLIWFANAWRQAGLTDSAVKPDPWKEETKSRDGYVQKFATLKFRKQEPLTREQIARLAHAIETRSTRIRVIEMEMRRAGGRDDLGDKWSGQLKVGFRYPIVSGQ